MPALVTPAKALNPFDSAPKVQSLTKPPAGQGATETPEVRTSKPPEQALIGALGLWADDHAGAGGTRPQTSAKVLPPAGMRKLDVTGNDGLAVTMSQKQSTPTPDGSVSSAQTTAIGQYEGVAGVTQKNTETTTQGAVINQQSNTTQVGQIGNGQLGVIYNNSELNTNAQGSSGTSTSASAHISGSGGGVAASQTTTASGALPTSTTNSGAATLTGSNAAITASHQQTNGTGPGSATTIIQGGASYDFASGVFQANGSYGTADYTVSGNVILTPDGFGGGLGVQSGEVGGNVSFMFEDGTTQLATNVNAGGFEAGFTYVNMNDKVTQTAVTQADGGTISTLLGGQAYLATGLLDQKTEGGNLGYGGIGGGGSHTSGSAFQIITTLPPDWVPKPDGEVAERQQEYLRQQREKLDGVQGLADVDLASLEDGTGVHFTSFNGWNAHGSLGYGGVSASGGYGENSAHDVTIIRQDGVITVSMSRTEGSEHQVGASLAGKGGVEFDFKSQDAHQFQFQVDPSDPAAMAAMELFLETGLLPGTGNLQDREAQQTYREFQKTNEKVDDIQSQIAQQQQALTHIPSSNTMARQAIENEIAALRQDLGDVRSELNEQRDELNDRWEQENGDIGDRPMAGITVSQLQDTHQEGAGVGVSTPIGDFSLGKSQETWVHQQYLGAQGKEEHSYGYEHQEYNVLGQASDSQSAFATTDTSGSVLTLQSYEQGIGGEHADTIAGIQRTDLPPAVLEAWRDRGTGQQLHDHAESFLSGVGVGHTEGSEGLSGTTTIAFNQQQMNVIATALNDPKNPASVQLWNDFADRTSTFLDVSVGNDRESPEAMKFGWDPMERGGYLQSLAALDADDPRAQALAGFGETIEEQWANASVAFAKVNSPREFQKLTPQEQQLFIDILDATSGYDDHNGQHNSFESIAAISLMQNEQARTQQYVALFEDANEEASWGGAGDGVWEFINFSKRFQDDPETYAQIQSGISFDWEQKEVEDMAASRDEEWLNREFNSAWDHQDNYYVKKIHDPDERRALEVLQAANMQGGPELVAQIIENSDVPLQDLIEEYSNPVQQEMMYDILTAAGYGAEIEDADVDFDR